MSKITKRTMRKDDVGHVHAMPDGSMTQSELLKPASSSQQEYHTHLYKLDGLYYETGPSYEGAGHTHTTDIGDTSGPMPCPMAERFGGKGTPPKESDLYGGSNPAPDGRHDTAVRVGTEWLVRSAGMTIARGTTREEAIDRAVKRYKRLAG